MGFGVIGAGRCYLHQQQHGSSCSGRTNIGEHFILSCTSAKHQQRFRADVFQIPQQRQALPVVCKQSEQYLNSTVTLCKLA
jgi:isoaspartyl peptidase/L-asparaginase-like protein (Ntn-hydrolase superfamily)